MATRPAIARLIDAAGVHSGIDTRYVVIPDAEARSSERFYPPEPGATGPHTKQRMDFYERWAKDLSREAVTRLFTETTCDPATIHRLITISCTGFFAPGVDYSIIQEFRLPSSVRRTHIGFMGCAAALVGFSSVLEWLHTAEAESSTTLLIALELCSLHLQTEPTRDNILANMIFADGCAAALFSTSTSYKGKLRLVRTHSHLFSNSAGFMGWRIGNYGFEMTLSSELPRIIEREAVPALRSILESSGMSADAVNHWVLHPGGKGILDALQQGLRLDDAAMCPSRTVLRNYGNMSSASILFVLKELLETRTIQPGETVCAVAFGPGLTMEVALLQGV